LPFYPSWAILCLIHNNSADGSFSDGSFSIERVVL